MNCPVKIRVVLLAVLTVEWVSASKPVSFDMLEGFS